MRQTIDSFLRRQKWILYSILFFNVFVIHAIAQNPMGLWNGSVSCGNTNLPIQIIISGRADSLFGILYSPRQFFCSNLDIVQITGSTLSVGADVPNNLHLQLSGSVLGSSWSPILTQGTYQCPSQFTRAGDVTISKLKIRPSYQTQPMWCWLTVGEMIFRYFGVLTENDPEGYQSQCRILSLIMQGSPNFNCTMDCNLCASLGGGSSREVAGMLSDFPRRLQVLGRNVRRIYSAITPVLSVDEISFEISNGRPVIIGISPSGNFNLGQSLNPFFPPMHVALIVGYMRTPNDYWYLVNDPYPFPVQNNPYILVGGIPLVTSILGVPHEVSYWIKASSMGLLHWTESILVK